MTLDRKLPTMSDTSQTNEFTTQENHAGTPGNGATAKPLENHAGSVTAGEDIKPLENHAGSVPKDLLKTMENHAGSEKA
ncbi:hypothetical protein [Streptomyces sp. NPDC086787]|uniref:hypothetical protein n=1 Tax=Streptomyces sp. NPDC086787 TaxID=3365759 RepID=UPI00382CB952